MTMLEDRLDVVDNDAIAPPDEQTRWHRVLWGDKSKKADQPRRRRDPSMGSLWRIRAVRSLMVIALVVGALGGAKALVSNAPGSTPADAQVTEPIVEVPRDVGVGGFGELYISAWLSAGRDNATVIAPYYSEPVDLTRVTAGRLWAARTAVISVEEVDIDYWAVTVGADVLVADEDGTFQPAGIRYYTLGVIKTNDGFGASGLPAQVPAPPTLEAPELVIDVLEHPSGDLEPIAAALDGFFGALLAGSGDLERYVAPETSLAPITPAPFTATEVRSLGARPEVADPNRHLVRAEVVATDDAGNVQILQYTAVMSQRAERWEVVELVAASPVGTQ